MPEYLDAHVTFTAGGALAKHLRVKLSSGVLAAAGVGASDETVELGTIVEEAFAAGDVRAVRLRNDVGVTKMVAAGAFAVGAVVYGAAGGKVDDVVSGAPLGIAKTAAGADGDVAEIIRY